MMPLYIFLQQQQHYAAGVRSTPQVELDMAVKWMERNKLLKLNTTQLNALHSIMCVQPGALHLSLKGARMDQVSKGKLLGLSLDRSMS